MLLIIAFMCGLVLGYLLTRQSPAKYAYPTAENAGKVTYVDDAGVCYRYEQIWEEK